MSNDSPNTKALLNLLEAAATLNVGRSTLYRLIDSGRLQTVYIGRRRLVDPNAIASYVASLSAAAK